MSRRGIPNQRVAEEDALVPLVDSRGIAIDEVILRITRKEGTRVAALLDIECYLKTHGVTPSVQYISLEQARGAASHTATPIAKEVYACIRREKLNSVQHKCSRLGLAAHIVPEVFTGAWSITTGSEDAQQARRKEAC